jgi:DNA mismatch repair protein MutL
MARRRGTTITVTELFHAVPARRKFLKSARGEWRAIAELLATIALVRRDVRITATYDGKTAFTAVPARTWRERLASVWAGVTPTSMIEVDDVQGPVLVRGLVEQPANVGLSARRVFVMVNGRAIRDTGVVRAAEAAYHSTIPSGARPSLALDIRLPGDAVDVNVHPAKAEVRFHDRWGIERVVEGAVRRAIGAAAAAPLFAPRFGGERSWSPAPSVDHDVMTLRRVPDAAPLFAGTPVDDAIDHDMPAVATSPSDVPSIAALPEPVDIPPLLQLRRTYLLFERDDGVVLIDQHSAHERVLYEKLMAKLVVQSVPMPHHRFDAERALRETLASLAGDRIASTASRHERLAMTVACKAAVKAGDLLSQGEMRALFADLARTTLPAHDVHGRATIVQLSWDELDRRFGRA